MTDTLEVVPHSREAEEGTLGGILIDPDAIVDVFDVLQSPDFYIVRHEWIYAAMVRLFLDGTPIDLLTIANDLKAQGQLDEIGGASFLTGLVNQVPNSLNTLNYAHIVEGYSVRRAMITKANQIATLAYNETLTIEEVALEYETLTEDRPAPSKTTLIMATAAADALEVDIDSGKPTGIPIGLAVLDEEFGGVPRQAVTMFLGEASTGKSAFWLQACESLNYSGQRALYITLEEPAKRMTGRRVFTSAGVDRVKFRNGSLTPGEVALLKQHKQLYNQNHKHLVFDQSARAVWQIRRSVHQSHAQLVVVDDLLHVHNENKGRQSGENDAKNLINTVVQLKDVAMDKDCAIVIIHHLDKTESEKLFGTTGTKPTMNKPPSLFNIPWASGLRYTIDQWISMVPDCNAKLDDDVMDMIVWLLKDKEGPRLRSEMHVWYDRVGQWFYDSRSKHLCPNRKAPQYMPTVTPPSPVAPEPDEPVYDDTPAWLIDNPSVQSHGIGGSNEAN